MQFYCAVRVNKTKHWFLNGDGTVPNTYERLIATYHTSTSDSRSCRLVRTITCAIHPSISQVLDGLRRAALPSSVEDEEAEAGDVCERMMRHMEGPWSTADNLSWYILHVFAYYMGNSPSESTQHFIVIYTITKSYTSFNIYTWLLEYSLRIRSFTRLLTYHKLTYILYPPSSSIL